MVKAEKEKAPLESAKNLLGRGLSIEEAAKIHFGIRESPSPGRLER
jgi:hypothetical protein